MPNGISLDEIKLSAPVEARYRLFVLRLDAMGALTGGNKHFKLKYNLEAVKQQGHKKILTFGGAWSNHLAAVAASRQLAEGSQQVEVIAIIRGEKPQIFSRTLSFCEEKGIKLHFVSREEYRQRHDAGYIAELKQRFGEFYLLPEGGSNELAVKGCSEIVGLIEEKFDVICCPVGSGGTLAGIASSIQPDQLALGFVAIRQGEYLEGSIAQLMTPLSQTASPRKGETRTTFKLIHDYHFGGFAKVTPQLRAFKKTFEAQNGFELDFVYTSKMLFGIFELMEKNYFKPGTRIVAVHTGGLQGNAGFTEL